VKRTFIAVDIVASEKLKEVYELVRYRMRLERIIWVSVNNLHITLNFLGDTEEVLLPAIAQSMEKAVKEQAAFELTLRSTGVFKDLRDPRVLWIGCDPCPNLQKIKTDLDRSLNGMGFKIESREFSPHLTLGRIKGMRQINQLAQLVSMYKDVAFQKQQIDSIVLYESKLTLSGSEYIPLRKFLLG
jgi:2'-5' RNA ligase